MEIKKYTSNVGKGIFLSWVRSLLIAVIALIVGIIILVISKSLAESTLFFVIAMIVSWPLDFFWRFKWIILQGDELIVKRFLRPTRRFDIKGRLVNYHEVDHGVYGATLFVIGYVRIIDPDGSITDIKCPFFTLKTLEKIFKDVRENQQVYSEGVICS